MGRHLGMFSAVPGGKFPHILCGSYSQECGRAAFKNSTNRDSTRYQFWHFIIQAINLHYYSCLCRRELNSDEQNSRFLIQGQLLCKDRSGPYGVSWIVSFMVLEYITSQVLLLSFKISLRQVLASA